MAILPMQSISNNNAGTYTSYMFSRAAGARTLPCWPCSGPRQLKFGDYQLVVMILGILGMANLHLRHCPIFLLGFLDMIWMGLGLRQLFFAYSIRWKCQEQVYLLPANQLQFIPLSDFLPPDSTYRRVRNESSEFSSMINIQIPTWYICRISRQIVSMLAMVH